MTAGYLELAEGYELPDLAQEIEDATVVRPHLALRVSSVEVADTIDRTYQRFRLGEEPNSLQQQRTSPILVSVPQGGDAQLDICLDSATASRQAWSDGPGLSRTGGPTC